MSIIISVTILGGGINNKNKIELLYCHNAPSPPACKENLWGARILPPLAMIFSQWPCFPGQCFHFYNLHIRRPAKHHHTICIPVSEHQRTCIRTCRHTWSHPGTCIIPSWRASGHPDLHHLTLTSPASWNKRLKKTIQLASLKKGKIWGNVPKNPKASQFQFRTFKTPWGLNFSKMFELWITFRPHPKKENQKH